MRKIYCLFVFLSAVLPLYAEDKAFDCSLLKLNSAEQIVCMNKELFGLERKLENVEKAATKAENKIHSPAFDLSNKEWLKKRNDCLNEKEDIKCLKAVYQARIAEIEARFRLADSTGTYNYNCGKSIKGNVVVTFFKTVPLTLIAKNGDKESFMIKEESETGSKYGGFETGFWDLGKETLIIWGYDKPEMRCKKLK